MKPKIKNPSTELNANLHSQLTNLYTPAERGTEQVPMNLWEPSVLKQIHDLIQRVTPKDKSMVNSDVVTEIIVTALKASLSEIGRGDLKLISRSIRELRYAFKIFRRYKDIRKVTIFGSARTKPSDPAYRLARSFAKEIKDRGFMVITGAGPGIMAAGNEGAGAKNSFGVNIRLPFEQFPNKYIAHQPTYIDCRYFFTRKLVFVKEASAAAFFPGGFGTLDEAFELLTLVQTGKCDPMPILLVDVPGGSFWKDWTRFIDQRLLKPGKISKEDLNLYRIVYSTKDAVNEILRFYSNYHSLRYVGDTLVMRLRHPLSDKDLAVLNKKFPEIAGRGKFERSGPLKEEENQPELAHLQRLIFPFNRINNGRLRQLIDFLNKE